MTESRSPAQPEGFHRRDPANRSLPGVLLSLLLASLGCSGSSDNEAAEASGAGGIGGALQSGNGGAETAAGGRDAAQGGSGGGGAVSAWGSGGVGGSGVVGGSSGTGSLPTGGAATGGGVDANTGGTAIGGAVSSGGAERGGGGNAQAGGANVGNAGGATAATGGSATAGGGATGAAPGTGGAGAGLAGGGAAEGSGGASEGDPALHWIGRVDQSDSAGARCAWSGCGVIARFEGTTASVELGGGQQYTVVVDGAVQPKLVASSGMNVLADGLAPGTHVVELYRRTEANQGESLLLGFDFGSGRLLAPPPAPSRRLEIIGDSITCGYGNEGPDRNCGFTPDTENHYLTYGAIAARDVGAELSTIAWSGKGVVCNYDDCGATRQDPMPVYYERTLPERQDSAWEFASWQADAVVINLGTNDFSTSVDPSQAEFESGYEALVAMIRAQYPEAFILCTVGPLLSGSDLATARSYIDAVVSSVSAAGDSRIMAFELDETDEADGYGCDWHPSLITHEKMAAQLTGVLEATLGW